MSSSGFLFSKTFFVLLFTFASLYVAVDVKQHGSLARSQTGQVLKDAGYLETVQIGLKKIDPYVTTVREAYQKNVAPYLDPYLNQIRRKIPGWQRQFKYYSDKVSREVNSFYNYAKAETPKYIEKASATFNHYGKVIQEEFNNGIFSSDKLKSNYNYYSKQAARQYDEVYSWASSKWAAYFN